MVSFLSFATFNLTPTALFYREMRTWVSQKRLRNERKGPRSQKSSK